MGSSPSCSVTAKAPGGEWTNYGHDLENTRLQDAERGIGPAEASTLGPVWTFSTVAAGGGGDIVGTPVVAGDCLFVGSTKGWVFGLNADTGKIVWRRNLEGQVQNSVTYYDGLVYTTLTNTQTEACGGPGCDGPYSAALDAADGRVVWTSKRPIDFQPGADAYGSPVLYDPTPRDIFRSRARSCAGRSLNLRLDNYRGQRLGKAVVRIDGKRRALLKRAALHRRFTLGRLPPGGFKLKVNAVIKPLRRVFTRHRPLRVSAIRRYPACKRGRTLRANSARVRRARILVGEDAVVIQGVSGWAAEGQASLADEETRARFQGSFVLIDATNGRRLVKRWTIHAPPKDCPSSTCPGREPDEFAGATIWSSAAVDKRTDRAYLATGNPFKPEAESERANAVLEIGVDRRDSEEFGQILGSAKGNVDSYVNAGFPCIDQPSVTDLCGDQDLDFGASPNLIRRDGKTLIGAGQKSGVYHLWDLATKQHVWQTAVGPPSLVGGIVGSPGYDGENVYGPITLGGYLWSLDAVDGSSRWFAPTRDLVHYGNPVALANGVVYTTTTAGALAGFDTSNGSELLSYSLSNKTQTGGDTVMTYAGTTVARHTVYAATGMQGNPNGFVIAFRPGGTGSPPPDTRPAPPGSAEKDSGDSSPFVLAGPGAQSVGYATPVASTSKGSKFAFRNFDTAAHNVTARTRASNGNPIFDSDTIALGGVTAVRGVEKLDVGQYEFFCTIHPNMTGTLSIR